MKPKKTKKRAKKPTAVIYPAKYMICRKESGDVITMVNNTDEMKWLLDSVKGTSNTFVPIEFASIKQLQQALLMHELGY